MAVNYTIVPRRVFPFEGLDAMTRYAFGLIYDRYRLSSREETKERWKDEHGVYCVFDRQDLADELGVSLPTLRRCMESMVKAGVLVMRRNGPHAAWRYYPTSSAKAAMGKLDELFRRMNIDPDEYVHSVSRMDRARQCE